MSTATFKPEVYADGIVNALQTSLTHGTQNLTSIPGLVKRVIEDECWANRYDSRLQRTVSFQSFVEFVRAPRPEGLGTTLEALQKLCTSAGDLVAVDLIDRNQDSESNPGERTDLVNNVNKVKRPEGNSTARSLRHLREKRKDLHKRVLAGELTPGAAMVAAGLRIKTHTIPHDVKRAAAAIKRHFTAAEVQAIKEQL